MGGSDRSGGSIVNRELSIGMALLASGILLGTVSMFAFDSPQIQATCLVVSAIDMIAASYFLYKGTKNKT